MITDQPGYGPGRCGCAGTLPFPSHDHSPGGCTRLPPILAPALLAEVHEQYAARLARARADDRPARGRLRTVVRRLVDEATAPGPDELDHRLAEVLHDVGTSGRRWADLGPLARRRHACRVQPYRHALVAAGLVADQPAP